MKQTMKTINTCCGSYVKHHIKTVKLHCHQLKVTVGIAVIYIGSEISYKGLGTGSAYHVIGSQSSFQIYPEDAESILKKS